MSNKQRYTLNDSFLSRFISLSLVVPTLAAQANMHNSIGVSRAETKHTSESSLQVPKLNPMLSVSNTYRQYAENAAGDQGGSTTSLGAMMPIAYMSNAMILADAKLDLARNPSDTTANIGLIYRRAFGEALVGAYGYFDFLQASSEDNYNTFSQVTLGSEYAKQDWAGRINVYVPFSTDVKDTDQRDLVIEANPADETEFDVYYNVIGQQARSGFDAEVSYTKAVSQSVDIELSAGGYHYPKSNGQEAVTGPRLRADISNSSAVGKNVMKTAIKTEYQSDSLRGSQVNIGLGVSYGGSSAHSSKSTYASNLWSRPVRRDLNSLFVTEGVSGTEEATFNGSTLSKFKLVHPGSNFLEAVEEGTLRFTTGSHTVCSGGVMTGVYADMQTGVSTDDGNAINADSHPYFSAFAAQYGNTPTTVTITDCDTSQQITARQKDSRVSGTSVPTYGMLISGATVSGHTIQSVQGGDAGNYDYLIGVTGPVNLTGLGGIKGGSSGAVVTVENDSGSPDTVLTLKNMVITSTSATPTVNVQSGTTLYVTDDFSITNSVGTALSTAPGSTLEFTGESTMLTAVTTGQSATAVDIAGTVELNGGGFTATSQAGAALSVTSASSIDFGNKPATLNLTQNSFSDLPALNLVATAGNIVLDDSFSIKSYGPGIKAAGDNVTITFNEGSSITTQSTAVQTTGTTNLNFDGTTTLGVNSNGFGIQTGGSLTLNGGDNLTISLSGSNPTAIDFTDITAFSSTDGLNLDIQNSTGATGILADGNTASLQISNIDFTVGAGAQVATLIKLNNDDDTKIGAHTIAINQNNTGVTLYDVTNPGSGTSIQMTNSLDLSGNKGITVFRTDNSLIGVITGASGSAWNGEVTVGQDSQVVNWLGSSYPTSGFPVTDATLGNGSTFITMPNIATTSDDVNAQFSGANGLTLTTSDDYTGSLLNLNIESAATSESENSTVTIKGNYTFNGDTSGVVTGLDINNQKQVLIEANLASSNFAGAAGSSAVSITGQNSDSGVTIAPAIGNAVDLTVGNNTTGITVEGSKVQLDTTAGGIKVSAQDMQAVMLQNGSVPTSGYLLNSYSANANTLELSNTGSNPVLTMDNLICECLTSCTSGNNPLRLEGKINISNTGSAAAIEHFTGSETARSEQLVIQGAINLVAGGTTAVNTDVIDLYLIAEEDSSITTNGQNAKNFTGISVKDSGPTSAPVDQQVAIVPNGEVEVRSGQTTVGGQTIDYSTVVYVPATGNDIVGTWNLTANGAGSNAVSSETTAGGSTITTQVIRAFVQADNGIEIGSTELQMAGGIVVRDSVIYSTGMGSDNYALSIDGNGATGGTYKVSGSDSSDIYTNLFLAKGKNAVTIGDAEGANGTIIDFSNTFVGTNFDLTSDGASFSTFADRANFTRSISSFETKLQLLESNTLSTPDATNNSVSSALTLNNSPNIVIGDAMLVSRYDDASVVRFEGMTTTQARTVMGTQDNTDSNGLVDPTGANGAMVMTGDDSNIATFNNGVLDSRLSFELVNGTYATEGVGSPVAMTQTINFNIGETGAGGNNGEPMPLTGGNFAILTKQSDGIDILNIEKAYDENNPVTGVLDLSNTVIKAGLRGGSAIFTTRGNDSTTFAGADGAQDISAVKITNISVTASAQSSIESQALLEIKLDNASLAANSDSSVLNITDLNATQASSLLISAGTGDNAANIQAKSYTPDSNSYGMRINLANLNRGDTFPYATSSASIADVPKLDGSFKFMNEGLGAGIQLTNQTPSGTPIAGNMVQGHLLSDSSLLEMDLYDGATGIEISGVTGVASNSVKLFDVSRSATDETQTMKFTLHGDNTTAIVVEDSSNIGVTGNYQIRSGASSEGARVGQMGIYIKNSDKIGIEATDGLLDIALGGLDTATVGNLPSPTHSAGAGGNLPDLARGAYIALDTTGSAAGGIVIEGTTSSATKTNATIAGDLLIATNGVPAIRITGADYSSTADGLFKPSTYSAAGDTDYTAQDILFSTNNAPVISVANSSGYSTGGAYTSLVPNEHGALTTIIHNKATDSASTNSAIEIADSDNFGLNLTDGSSVASLNIETYSGSQGAINVTDSDNFTINAQTASTQVTITENGSDGVVNADTISLSGGAAPSITGKIQVTTDGVKAAGKSVLSISSTNQSADDSIDISGLTLTATDATSGYTSTQLGTVESAGTGGTVLSLKTIGSNTNGTARALTLPTMTISGYQSFISVSDLSDTNLIGNQATSATTPLADAVGVSIASSSNTSWNTGYTIADINDTSTYQWTMNGAGSTAVSVSGGEDVTLSGNIAAKIGTDATGVSITSVDYSTYAGPFSGAPSLKIHGVATPNPTSSTNFSKSNQGLVISGLTSSFDATNDSDSDGNLLDGVTVALGASSITSVANPIMVSEFDRLYFTLGAAGTASTIQSNAVSTTTAESAPWAQTQADETVYGALFTGKALDNNGNTVSQLGVRFVNTELQYNNTDAAPQGTNDTNAVVLGIQNAKPIERFPAATPITATLPADLTEVSYPLLNLTSGSRVVVGRDSDEGQDSLFNTGITGIEISGVKYAEGVAGTRAMNPTSYSGTTKYAPLVQFSDDSEIFIKRETKTLKENIGFALRNSKNLSNSIDLNSIVIENGSFIEDAARAAKTAPAGSSFATSSAYIGSSSPEQWTHSMTGLVIENQSGSSDAVGTVKLVSTAIDAKKAESAISVINVSGLTLDVENSTIGADLDSSDLDTAHSYINANEAGMDVYGLTGNSFINIDSSTVRGKSGIVVHDSAATAKLAVTASNGGTVLSAGSIQSPVSGTDTTITTAGLLVDGVNVDLSVGSGSSVETYGAGSASGNIDVAVADYTSIPDAVLYTNSGTGTVTVDGSLKANHTASRALALTNGADITLAGSGSIDTNADNTTAISVDSSSTLTDGTSMPTLNVSGTGSTGISTAGTVDATNGTLNVQATASQTPTSAISVSGGTATFKDLQINQDQTSTTGVFTTGIKITGGKTTIDESLKLDSAVTGLDIDYTGVSDNETDARFVLDASATQKYGFLTPATMTGAAINVTGNKTFSAAPFDLQGTTKISNSTPITGKGIDISNLNTTSLNMGYVVATSDGNTLEMTNDDNSLDRILLNFGISGGGTNSSTFTSNSGYAMSFEKSAAQFQMYNQNGGTLELGKIGLSSGSVVTFTSGENYTSETGYPALVADTQLVRFTGDIETRACDKLYILQNTAAQLANNDAVLVYEYRPGVPNAGRIGVILIEDETLSAASDDLPAAITVPSDTTFEVDTSSGCS